MRESILEAWDIFSHFFCFRKDLSYSRNAPFCDERFMGHLHITV
ncbi:hypothetical protein RUMHYD_03681 [Blautia hydrogenotrophica DSM 10507]|uniref:Uncharacterized protein n=1 Tax=Blautia hydrogenotrophica (strain DSM 10507 / JCM 14656 / S5a33) TaxID=476272 RepID=C0CS15_BLAHS|nr:hypothetical protein RUMHYD_03681 [Blautia hydrogenotrophica DSM 10507]